MRPFLYLSVFLIVATSCNQRTSYINNAPNVPMHEKKEQLKATAHIGWNHIEEQLSFSLPKRTAIMMNGFQGLKGRYFGELGIGTYRQIAKKHFYEGFVGYGLGSLKGSVEKSTAFWFPGLSPSFEKGYYDIKYQRYFIQGTYWFRNQSFDVKMRSGPRFAWGVTFRTSYVHFDRYNFNIIEWGITDEDVIITGDRTLGPGFRKSDISWFIFDPMLVIRYKNQKRIECILQVGRSFVGSGILRKQKEKMAELRLRHPIYSKMSFNLGFVMPFDLKLKPRNEKPGLE